MRITYRKPTIPQCVKELTGTEWSIIAAIIALLSAIIIPSFSMAKKDKERDAAQYAAFIKLTGNEKQLTQEEFALIKDLGVIEYRTKDELP